MRHPAQRGTALCRALNNAADESLRLARRVKINEIKSTDIFYLLGIFSLLAKLSQPVVIKYYSNFSSIFVQYSGI